MRTNRIIWSLGMVAAALLLVGQARADGELTLNSEFMVMDSFGTDINVFEIKIEGDTGNSTNDGEDIAHDKDFGWRGDLQYRNGGWGAGISGFRFENEGDENQFLRGDALPAVSPNEISLRTSGSAMDCLRRGNFQGHCYGAVDSELDVFTVDLYGIRELVQTPDVAVDMLFGLRLGQFEWDMDSLAALVQDDGFSIDSSEEPVANASTSKNEDTLVGPFLSLLTSGRYGRFRVEGQLSQAVVFGELTQEINRFQYNSGSATLNSLILQETARLDQDQDAVIPITEFRVKVGYDILDWLTLGVGAFASTWFNVPEPPNMEAIDRTIGNSSISSDEENLTFLGATFSLEARFGAGDLRMPNVRSWLP